MQIEWEEFVDASVVRICEMLDVAKVFFFGGRKAMWVL